ncbi:MAG: AAA family ATPase [Sulfuricurvum sp.]
MNVTEFQQLLAAADQANDSVIVESLHGVGKSDSIHSFANKNDYHCEDLFLSMFDTGDLCGLPRAAILHGQHATVWSSPDWHARIVNEAFPQVSRIEDLVISDNKFKEHLTSTWTESEIGRGELNEIYSAFYRLYPDVLNIALKSSTVYNSNGRRSILFLDELNRSNLDVRQAALQLILNKELHSHKLPYIDGKCTIIVSAINPSDLYQVDELDAALLDRFLHAELKADAKEWLAWARANNINQVVQDYIAEHPDRIHWTPKDGGIGATPRSWAKLAAYMDNIANVPKEIHFPIMKGKIGSELGGQFLSFFNNYAKVVKLEDIEAAVEKAMKRSSNPEVIAKAVAKLTEKQEAIQKSQLAETLFDKYVVNNSGDALSSMPLIAFLYAIEVETLASFLKSHKTADITNYSKLAEYDKVLNNKGLFTRIMSKIS